jgi:hypothetical protein
LVPFARAAIAPAKAPNDNQRMAPPIHYARSGDVNIAYQVFGDGPHDALMIPGWVTHLGLDWSEPR